jgi:hypothetical protein
MVTADVCRVRDIKVKVSVFQPFGTMLFIGFSQSFFKNRVKEIPFCEV